MAGIAASQEIQLDTDHARDLVFVQLGGEL